MKHNFQLLLLILYLTTTKSSIYSDLKQNVLSFFKRSIDRSNELEEFRNVPNHVDTGKYLIKQRQDKIDARVAKKKAKVLKIAKKHEKDLNDRHHIPVPITSRPNIGKEHYHMDPVLNFMKRRSAPNIRRKYSTSDQSSSSSLEMKEWKDEWKEHWIQKKFEAVNASQATGDTVNMVAARPWGVPCGDPNQHDMPWGTCMLAMECEAEFRIYRGDYFCGRSQFVCCALQLTSYDLYQGFDASFADTSLSSDTEEKKARMKGSKEKSRKRKQKEKRKRKRDRLKRKKKIKRNIRKIVKEIRKILNRTYKNGTNVRKRKTKQLKKFIEKLKKQYRHDRQSVKDIHEVQLIKVDAAVQKRLDQIKSVNQNFVKNSTFRDIIVNGTINKKAARMLMQAYPELASMLKARRSGGLNKPKDYLEYDVEYGMVYN